MGLIKKDYGKWVCGELAVLDSLTIAEDVDITGDVVLAGDFAVGISGTGSDLKAWGDTAGYYFLWDADQDTNGGVTVIGTSVLTGNLTVDGTIVSLDGSTSVRGISAGFTSLESPANRFGVSSTIYMQVATTAVSGITAITHTGTAPAVTWAADSLTFTGTFEVVGASTFDAITSVGDLSVDGATALIDGSTSVRGVSAGFTSLEAPDIRFGYDASDYMKIAVTTGTGDVAITHTGTNKAVTWTASGGFDFVGAIALDAITAVGDFSVDGTTAIVDGSTSVRGVSAGFTSLESPANRFGVSDTIYMQVATTAVSGITAITHTGTAPTVTWTADSFDFVGGISLDGVTISGAVGMADDQVLTIGTTTATAETKITMEFDETTTGISSFVMGSSSVPQVLKVDAGAAVIPVSLNVEYSAGDGNMDDYIGRYDKISILGIGDSGLTAVGHAIRAYVGATGTSNAVIDELYASQPWVKHEGTGAITAMSAVSAKCDVSADAFTTTTINAGHFHIEGAATITGQFDGVLIEVYPDVTCLDSGITVAVNSGAVVGNGFALTGTATNGVDLSGATLTTNIVLSSGARIMTGTADPNATVTGVDGSLYLRTGTTNAATILYVCTGATNWTAIT